MTGIGGGNPIHRARMRFAQAMLAKGGRASDRLQDVRMIHKHERALHKGQPLTKFAAGGLSGLPRTYVPFSGNPSVYGFGPEHRFFEQAQMPIPLPMPAPPISAETAASYNPNFRNLDAGASNRGGDRDTDVYGNNEATPSGGVDANPNAGLEYPGGASMPSWSDFTRPSDIPNRVPGYASLIADAVMPGASIATGAWNAGVGAKAYTNDLIEKARAQGLPRTGVLDTLAAIGRGALAGITGMGQRENLSLEPGTASWNREVESYNRDSYDPTGHYGTDPDFTPGSATPAAVEQESLDAPSRAGYDNYADYLRDNPEASAGSERGYDSDYDSWDSVTDRISDALDRGDYSEAAREARDSFGEGDFAAGGSPHERFKAGIGHLAMGGSPGGPPMAGVSQMSVPQMFVTGGAATALSGGQDDDVPAFLSENEFVIPADVVADLGDGNPKAGADQLWTLIRNVRKHKAVKGQPPKARGIGQYMDGGR